MAWYEAAQKLDPILQKGDISSCIKNIENEFINIPDSPFHMVLNLDFTNPPEEVAKYFENFISQESRRFTINAVYTETNGFDINPDRWYFDAFAYEAYGGHEDKDWLSDWQSGNYPDMTLTGMELLQKVYENEFIGNNKYDEASGYASFLVLLKFQNLIKKTGPLIKNIDFPLLATAHDYDLIYEFNKNA